MKMKKSKLVVFSIMFWLSSSSADYKIEGSFYNCQPTDQLVDIDIKQNDIANALNIFKKFDDEFNFIQLLNNKFVVYSENGELFTTICEQLNEIFIPKSFSDCTIDLPVYFMIGNKKQVLYMTKSGVLRNTSTVSICKEDIEFFNIAGKHVERVNKSASIVEKKISKLFQAILNNSYHVTNTTSEFQTNNLADYYYKHFAKNKLFVTIRDIRA